MRERQQDKLHNEEPETRRERLEKFGAHLKTLTDDPAMKEKIEAILRHERVDH